MASIIKDSSFGSLSNDINKFGQDITGVTAREAARSAANMQEKAQAKLEAEMKDKETIKNKTLQYKQKRNMQQAKAMENSGRSSTLLNGTTGVPDMAQPTGAKTLLGQ